jgi:tetratricopeptide (TPR) repeat protein
LETFPENLGDNKFEIAQLERMIRDNESFFYDVQTYEDFINFYLSKGEFEKALTVCDYALAQHPFSSEVLFLTAQVNSDIGNIHTALAYLEKASIYQPLDTEILLLKGQCFLELEDYKEALDIFSFLATIGQEKDQIHFHIGEAQQGLGMYEESILSFEKALTLNNGNREVIYELLTAYEINGKLDKCIDIYQKIIDDDPFNTHAWCSLGVIQDKMGDYPLAIDSFDFALAIDEENATALYHKGLAHLSNESYGLAIECLEKTVDLDGFGDENLLINLAHCFFKENRIEDAVKYYQKTLLINDKSTAAYSGVGICMYEQENWLQALHFFEKALELDSQNTIYLFSKADTEYQMGNTQSAIETYNILLQLEPDNLDALLNLSYVFQENDMAEEAFTLLKSAINEAPKCAELYYRLTAYLVLEGNYKEGFTYLENALILDFEKHEELFEFFPELETQKALMKLIDQYR